MNTKSFFSKRRILVTGCCGTVGRELTRQLLEEHAIELVATDNNESELFFLEQHFSYEFTVVTWPHVIELRQT